MPNIAKEENAYIKQNDFEILKLQITSTKGVTLISLKVALVLLPPGLIPIVNFLERSFV
jgi:hypothetical protein